MGQIEVFEYLKNKRLYGSTKFYSVAEIQRGLKEQGCSNGLLHGVRGDVISLEWSGYLESEVKGSWREWRRCFRLKKKYLKPG